MVMSYIERARKACGMTQEEAAKLAHMSRQTWRKKELEPDAFTMAELEAFRGGLDEYGKLVFDSKVKKFSQNL